MNKIANPPKFNKKILFSLKTVLVSTGDILWFIILSAILLPCIMFVSTDFKVQISFAVAYILLSLIMVARWDGIWLRDLIGYSFINIFTKKIYSNVHTKKFCSFGKFKNGGFVKDAIFSQFFVLKASSVSLIRDDELRSRVSSLTEFFNIPENISLEIVSIDQPIDVRDNLEYLKLRHVGNDPIFELINWDIYNQVDSIQRNDSSQKLYLLKVSVANNNNAKVAISRFFSKSQRNLQDSMISIMPATSNQIRLYCDQLFNSNNSLDDLNEKLLTGKKNQVSDVQRMVFGSSFFRIDNKNKFKKFYQILTVMQNPAEVGVFWLNEIFNQIGIITINRLTANNPREAKAYINNTVRFLKLRYQSVRKDLVEEKSTLKFYEQIEETADWISSGNSTLLNSEMYIIISADTKKQMVKKSVLTKQFLKSQGFKIDSLKFLQRRAFFNLMGVK